VGIKDYAEPKLMEAPGITVLQQFNPNYVLHLVEIVSIKSSKAFVWVYFVTVSSRENKVANGELFAALQR
jgi:hypothetical protein